MEASFGNSSDNAKSRTCAATRQAGAVGSVPGFYQLWYCTVSMSVDARIGCLGCLGVGDKRPECTALAGELTQFYSTYQLKLSMALLEM